MNVRIFSKPVKALNKTPIKYFTDTDQAAIWLFHTNRSVRVHVRAQTPALHSQAVDHGPPVSPVVLLLPLGQPPHQLEDGAFGQRRVPVGRPADELEVLHQAVAILRLRHRGNKRHQRYSPSLCLQCHPPLLPPAQSVPSPYDAVALAAAQENARQVISKEFNWPADWGRGNAASSSGGRRPRGRETRGNAKCDAGI